MVNRESWIDTRLVWKLVNEAESKLSTIYHLRFYPVRRARTRKHSMKRSLSL